MLGFGLGGEGVRVGGEGVGGEGVGVLLLALLQVGVGILHLHQCTAKFLQKKNKKGPQFCQVLQETQP